MRKLKLVALGFILGILALGTASEQFSYWPRWTTLKLGHPDSTDNLSLRLGDARLYVEDFYGNNSADIDFRDAINRRTIADSLVRAPYIQAGTAFGAPDYPLRVNGNSLFYDNMYLRDGYGLLNYSGNGARIKLINATGTQILNNKGVSFQVAPNAAASALLLDSAQTYMTAPQFVIANGDVLIQIVPISGSYGWIGTQSDHPLYLGANNSGKILINTNGTLRFLAYGAGTLRSDASGNVTATASDTVGLGASLWANRNSAYFTRANSDTWNSNQHQSWAGTPTTQALQDGRLRAWPFWVGKGYSIDSLRFEVSTGASGNVAFAIYIDANGDLYPDTRVLDLGAYSTTNAAVYGDTSTVSLVAGGTSFTFADNTMYWLGAHAKGGATLRSVPLGSVPFILGYNPALAANTEYTAWSLSSSYTYPNSCPDPFSGSASKLAAVPPPLLIWRVKP